MTLRHLTLLLCVSLSLTGCSALLERNYATVEPHSSKFWESEAAGTLRAENYQDIVNDLLIRRQRQMCIRDRRHGPPLQLRGRSDGGGHTGAGHYGGPAGDAYGRLCRGVYHRLQPVPAGVL